VLSKVVAMNHTQPQHPETRWHPALLHALSEAADLFTAAATLARAGVPVFPCLPGEKQPLTGRGFHDATTDANLVGAWWERWPEANIGMPTGVASGVDVVDVDVHAGGSGFRAFERARAGGLTDRWAWLVRTPSSGLHAYFPRAGEGEQRSWQVPGQHVDFRGDGGYVIVPPSRATTTDGQLRGYELIAIAQHDPAPVDARALRTFLDPPRPMRPPPDAPARGARPDKLAAWVASRPEGGRNQGLFWAACRLAEDGHGFAQAASVLGDAARSAGLPEHEALATIRSAYRIATRLGPVNPSGPPRAVEAVGL
jgi:hypothetical protein